MPATYDAQRKSLVKKAARTAGLPRVTMVAEPVAAVVGAAEGGQLPKVSIILVYDLGGGTFDAAVVRIEDGRHVLGARGLSDFGSTDIDLLIEQDFGQQVANELGPLLAGQYSADPQERSRALRARIAASDMCREIKPLDARREVPDGRRGTPAGAGTASERYRQAIIGCWADGRLMHTEADWLRDLGTNVLQLLTKVRHRVEREVLGDTLDRLLDRQRETTAEHYHVALRLIRDTDTVAALKAIPRRRLDMLLGSVELFCNHDFPDCELRADQRTALLGEQPWPAFVAAVRVAVNLDPAATDAMSRLRELADELNAATISFHRKDGTVTKFTTWRSDQLPPVLTAARKLL